MVFDSLISLSINRWILVISLVSTFSHLSQAFHHSYHYEPSFFIFGDSILDAGNNNYINTSTFVQADFWPYGITFFHNSTARFSNGRVIPDFIGHHANLPFTPPFLQPGKQSQFDHGANFASAASGALVETNQGLVIDLHMQLRYFKEVNNWLRKKYGDTKARRRVSTAVYLISVGANDYGTFNSTLKSSFTISEYVNMVIGNITSVVEEIYKIGGRKFVLLNVGPFGCAPILRILNTEDDGCLKKILKYIIQHNEILLQVLDQLQRHLPGFKSSVYDFYTSSLQRINHPLLYGFKEGKTACCGTGKFRGFFSCGGKRIVKEYELCKTVDDYVFWDSAHTTEKVQTNGRRNVEQH